MSDEVFILREFEHWRDNLLENPVSNHPSIDRFLEERENTFNSSRISEALKEVDDALRRIAADEVPMPADQVRIRFERIGNILVDDRPYQIFQSITGESERIFN